MKKIISAVFAALIVFLTSWAQVIPVTAEPALSSDIVSDYAYVFDTDTSQILMDKNAEEKMYPASMTKIMTAIIAIENDADLDRRITITSEMLNGLSEMNASVAGFQRNDDPTVRDLLYGLALPSGADAANALAIDLCGDIPSFVARMNQKALSLGLSSTHFANVTGLHDDDHYSTAENIGKLLQYCIQDPVFAEIFSSASYTTSSLPSAENGIVLRSTAFQAIASNGYSVGGLVGAKTGYTDEAGHCMASWDTVNNMHLIAVTAHADTSIYASTHIQDLETILNDLQSYEKKNILSANDAMKDITVHALFHCYAQTVYVPQDLILDVPMDADIECATDLPDEIDLSNDDQEIPYTVRIYVNSTLYKEDAETCMMLKDTNPITRILRSIRDLFQ